MVRNILCYTHSGLRWLVVLAALIALAVLLISLIRRRDSYTGRDRLAMTVFSSVVGLQWIIGLVYFLTWSLQGAIRWTHTLVMTAALAVAHIHVMIKRRPARARLIGGVVSILVTFGLIYIGVAWLPYPNEWAFSSVCEWIPPSA